MLTFSSRIWTQVTDSISNDDKDYAKQLSFPYILQIELLKPFH